jgi:putative acetyltransferase
VIEPEHAADHQAVRRVVAAAFAHHPEAADLVGLIRASPQYVPQLALVARRGGQVVGHVMISHAELLQADGTGWDVLTLSPLSVRPDVQRQGVGSALVVEALRRADATGAALVTLEGSPAYYPRFGFRDARTLGVTIDLPDWAPRDAGQVYPLSAYDPAVRGRLVYPPAFAAV